MLETPKTLDTRSDAEKLDPTRINDLVFFSKNFKDETYLVKMGNQQERLRSALAYVLGTYLGDGTVYVGKRHGPKVILQVCDLDFAQKFKHECGLVAPGTINTKILPITNTVSPTWLFAFVHKSLGTYLLESTRKKEVIPNWVLTDPKAFIPFFEAIVDGEGHIKLGGACRISSTSDWIKDIQKALADLFNVNSVLGYYKQKNTKWKDYYMLRIPSRELVKLNLHLNIERKQARILKSSETTCYAPSGMMGEDIVRPTARSVEVLQK